MTISVCGPTCACNEGCGLRKTARGLGVPVEVRWTGSRAWGVFTRTRVRKGAYIGSYMGEYLPEKTAKERYDVVKACTYMNTQLPQSRSSWRVGA